MPAREGDRRIELVPITTEPDGMGGERQVRGAPIVAWGVRRDRHGTELEIDDAAYGTWTVEYRVRRIGLERLSEGWELRDEDGIVHDIQSVAEDPLARRQWWLIRAERRDPR